MAKQVPIQWNITIEVGTKNDDGNLYARHLYMMTTANKRQKLILNRAQARALVAALVETISEPPITEVAS